MKKILTRLILSLLVGVFLYSCSVLGEEKVNDSDSTLSVRSTYNINRPPSKKAPGGLEPEQVPQFIIFGYDDNQYPDGMYNILDVYKGLTNPAGVGNADTFDGTPAKASFYVNPAVLYKGKAYEVSDEVLQSWKDAYAQGHEIGNHTWLHQHGLQFDKAKWIDEISKAHDYIINKIGVATADLTGFRTPFLEYNKNTMLALKELGYEYDNSFEGGWRSWPPEDGSTLFFPYTMDNGRPEYEEGRDHGVVPGFWEMPTDCIIFPDRRKTTGFDYNLWFLKSATKQEFIDMLKYSLDKKYNGNRSPMNFGTHTNYHSQEADDLKYYDPKSYALLKSTVAERTAAIKEFLEYAVTLPGVRVVTTQQALEWQKNPVIMLGKNKVTISATTNGNGTVTPESSLVHEGSNVNFTVNPANGYEIDMVELNGVPIAFNGNNFLVKNVRANSDINVKLRVVGSQPLEANYAITSDWGSGFGASLTIKNSSNEPVDGWEVLLVFNGDQRISGWGADITQTGNIASIKNSSGNRIIQPGQSVSVGFNGSYTGENLPPVIVIK